MVLHRQRANGTGWTLDLGIGNVAQILKFQCHRFWTSYVLTSKIKEKAVKAFKVRKLSWKPFEFVTFVKSSLRSDVPLLIQQGPRASGTFFYFVLLSPLIISSATNIIMILVINAPYIIISPFPDGHHCHLCNNDNNLHDHVIIVILCNNDLACTVPAKELRRLQGKLFPKQKVAGVQ